MIPCERISDFENGQLILTSPPRRDAISNIFSHGLLQRMSRVARNSFQYTIINRNSVESTLKTISEIDFFQMSVRLAEQFEVMFNTYVRTSNMFVGISTHPVIGL